MLILTINQVISNPNLTQFHPSLNCTKTPHLNDSYSLSKCHFQVIKTPQSYTTSIQANPTAH